MKINDTLADVASNVVHHIDEIFSSHNYSNISIPNKSGSDFDVNKVDDDDDDDSDIAQFSTSTNSTTLHRDLKHSICLRTGSCDEGLLSEFFGSHLTPFAFGLLLLVIMFAVIVCYFKRPRFCFCFRDPSGTRNHSTNRSDNNELDALSVPTIVCAENEANALRENETVNLLPQPPAYEEKDQTPPRYSSLDLSIPSPDSVFFTPTEPPIPEENPSSGRTCIASCSQECWCDICARKNMY